ncbi:MAG: hypothetical protein LH485_07780 [Sphingomonas bacterium]|nr:hypothetical protein [Sphingomonas bacterium]
MISLTPLNPEQPAPDEHFGEVQYLLRRADEESVAAIRATDDRVHDSHAGMAKCYSIKSLELIARLDGARV